MNFAALVTAIKMAQVGISAYKAIVDKIDLADVQALVDIVPAIIDIAKTVQESNPTMDGADKLNFVYRFLKMGYSAGTQIADLFEREWPHVEALISAVVDSGKSLGLIPSSKTAAAA